MAVNFKKLDAALFAIQGYLKEVSENNGPYLDHAEWYLQLVRNLRTTVTYECELAENSRLQKGPIPSPFLKPKPRAKRKAKSDPRPKPKLKPKLEPKPKPKRAVNAGKMFKEQRRKVPLKIKPSRTKKKTR